MSIELRYLDDLKFCSKLSVNFACEYSEDDRIFIISDTDIYIIALKGYLANSFPSISCTNVFFKTSNFIPSANVDIDINSFHTNLERNDLYESTMCEEYSADLNHTSPASTPPLCAQWSPRGIVGKTDCLLAVLSCYYSLEIYVKYIDENELTEYCSICNITQEFIDIRKLEWKYSDRLPYSVKLSEMKRRVQTISCTAFTWGHIFKINNKEYCAIFIGHLNGNITVWRLKGRPSNSKEVSKSQFIGQYSTQLGRITKMHWHCTKEYGGGLSFADSEGKMSVLHIYNLDKEVAIMDNELAFLTVPDNVAVEKITVLSYEDYTYIILIKQSFIIIYGLDDLGKVFDQKVCNAEHYYITGIHHFNNEIIVLTLPGVLKQYTLSVVNKKIYLNEKNIPIKMDPVNYRTHGFFFSKNTVLFGMVTYPCKLRSLFKPKTYFNVYIFHNSTINPTKVIWNNNSGSLRDLWDCFEALRLICLKDKRFPWLEIPCDLDYDNLSLFQFKILRCLAKLSEMVFNTIPIIKSYDIKPFIILHYLVQIKLILKRINKLLSIKESGKELSLFQMHSIDIQNFYLKEMVVKNVLAKANVGMNFINEMKHVMSIANELQYPSMKQCIWCGEKIIGLVCLPPHADSRCSISMMPLFLKPAYKCPFCKVLAHKNIEEEEDIVFCTFCDVPMEKLYTDENSEYANRDYKLKNGEVQSVCFDDCLMEEVSLSDNEENENEYIIISDSEDDAIENESKLRSLYISLKNMSLEDIVKFESEEEINDEISTPGSSKITKLNEGEDIKA